MRIEIKGFSTYKLHQKCDRIIQQLLQILEHVLELPPFALRKKIRANASSEQQLRYMHYTARNLEENEKMGHIYAGGHTDLGVLTLLFRQPVAGLQIQNAEGEWRWVQPRDDALTVNICDALSMISCQHLKSTIHRVHAPPADQRHLDRIGVLYFGRFVVPPRKI
jgi:Isopenicillin N synthase and related dioxygenases